ncbi:MAG: WbqC family protein [Bacteroidia bacterium]|nr:WbqC family protein [Bacteroidia bacterium]MCZ2278103.1 WbqC family protein [Bacteroidia bacterium]
MKVAVMQPYFFPYIGYFQLINAVDGFVFYDDVNYIKRGWINRNRILINQKAQYVTIPVKDSSQNRLIYETEVIADRKVISKILKSIELAYKKAPFFIEVFEIISTVLNKNYKTISTLAIESIECWSDYLEIKTDFFVSSENFSESSGMEKTQRLIAICTQLNAYTYLNSIGGVQLYSRADFARHGIELSFLKTNDISYKQFDNNFVTGLSIIDVLMFNKKEKVKTMLNEYDLI